MTEIEKKQIEIKLLDFLLCYLCLSELPEIGRIAIKRLRNKYQNEISSIEK
jgi:hypothetical protein